MGNAATIKTQRNRRRQLGGNTRYNRYVKVRGKGKRWLLGEDTHGPCAICKNDFLREELTVDHIVPIRLGGAIGAVNDLGNLQLLCRPCHKEKSAKEITP